MSVTPKRINKKKKFCADGVFFAELNHFFKRELSEDGYGGLEVRVTPQKTEIIIRATRTRNVLGYKGKRIRELTAVIQKRFGFQDEEIEIFAERVLQRGLNPDVQAESLKYKILQGLAVRRACYGVMRVIMEASAHGVEVIISGKLRTQRAKSMKFCDGYMKKSGQAAKNYVVRGVRHLLLKSGIMGIQVKIMLPWDPTGKMGPKDPLPDVVRVKEPKLDQILDKTPSQTQSISQPISGETGTEEQGGDRGGDDRGGDDRGGDNRGGDNRGDDRRDDRGRGRRDW